MGWGTWTNADIYFSRETFREKYQVENELEECNNTINGIVEDIIIWCFGNPKDFAEQKDLEGNPISLVYFKNDVKERLEWLEEQYIRRYKLELLLENWDKRDGDFIDNDINNTVADYSKFDENKELKDTITTLNTIP